MLSTIWKTLFFNPFLNILLLLYAVLGQNLGLAVIVLAVLIRILLLPSTRKQMEMTKKMSGMKPKLEAIQKKYKNNKTKLGEEQMKLYKEEGYNPIGCISSFLPQIFILAAIFGVINTINNGNFNGLYAPVRDFVFSDGEEVLQNLHFLWWDLQKSYTAFEGVSLIAGERMPYLILGILVGLIQYLSTGFLQKFQGTMPLSTTKKANKDEPMSAEEIQMQMNRSMMTIFPVLTAYITLSQPAVLGVYWLAQSVMFIVQYYFIDKVKFGETMREMIPSVIQRRFI